MAAILEAVVKECPIAPKVLLLAVRDCGVGARPCVGVTVSGQDRAEGLQAHEAFPPTLFSVANTASCVCRTDLCPSPPGLLLSWCLVSSAGTYARGRDPRDGGLTDGRRRAKERNKGSWD